MRVNSRVFTERTDMLATIRIPSCSPKELRDVAEKIINMAAALDFSITDYNSIEELDKQVTAAYWKTYDGLLNAQLNFVDFTKWYLKATPVDTISRAMRWLIQRNYLLIKPEVQERASRAASKYAKAIKGGK